jgi:hypothetical protein
LPGYTQVQVRQEGVAEFLRYYLADAPQARALAPTFVAHFEQFLEANDPRVLHALRQAQDMVTAYVNQPEMARLRAQVDFNDTAVAPGGIRERMDAVRNWWRTQYTHLFNALYPIERVTRRSGRRTRNARPA